MHQLPTSTSSPTLNQGITKGYTSGLNQSWGIKELTSSGSEGTNAGVNGVQNKESIGELSKILNRGNKIHFFCGRVSFRANYSVKTMWLKSHRVNVIVI